MPLPLAAAAVTALLGIAAAPASRDAAPSWSWKATVTVEGARPGQALQEAQIWLAGGRMRLEERSGATGWTNVLQSGAEVYIWVEGEDLGVRIASALAARGRPMHGFVRRTGEIRSRGRRTGEETVDGHACDVYEIETREDGKGTYWLARDLEDFPLKAILEPRLYLPNSAKPIPMERIEYRYRDVRRGEPIPAGKLEPPPGVRFENATEVFTGRGRPIPR